MISFIPSIAEQSPSAQRGGPWSLSAGAGLSGTATSGGPPAASPAPATPQPAAPRPTGGSPFAGMYDAGAQAGSGGGDSLPYRAEMERAFGQDFSGVHVQLGQSLDGVGALAVTDGEQVRFESQRPSKELVAHELVHVVQQRRHGGSGPIRDKPGVSQGSDAAEREAESLAPQLASGQSVDVCEAPSASQMRSGDEKVKKARAAITAFTTAWTLEEIERIIRPILSIVLGIFGSGLADIHDAKHAAAEKKLRKDAQQILSQLNGLNEDETEKLSKLISPEQMRLLIMTLSGFGMDKGSKGFERLKDASVVNAALNLEGKLYWAGGSGADSASDYQIKTSTSRPTDDRRGDETNTNEFAEWIRGGKEPTDSSKMNCWEAVLFSGYQAGVISKAWIFEIHQKAAKQGTANGVGGNIDEGFVAYYEVLSEALGYSKAKTFNATKGTVPQKGDLVFFLGLAHVALALGSTNSSGGHEVMSLWILPGRGARLYSKFQRTTIEEISGAVDAAGFDSAGALKDIRYGDSPW